MVEQPDTSEKAPLARRRLLRQAGLGVVGIAAMGSVMNSPLPAFAVTTDGTLLDQGGGVFNVKSSAYGAAGNGATDDTAAINAAVAAASVAGGVVYFPTGIYKISSTITVSARGVRLVGASRWASTIKLTYANGDGVRFLGYYCGAEELTFDTFVTRTSGAYISTTDNATADTGWWLNIGKCVFESGWDGINGTATQDLFIHDCNFKGFRNHGIELGGWQASSNIYISRCEMSCPTQANAGIYIGRIGSGVYVSQVDMFQTGFGIDINPPTGSTTTAIFLDQVQCDSCQYNGIAANSAFVASPGIVDGLFITNSWFQGNTNVGVQIGYWNTVRGVQVVGCQILNNGQAGMSIDAHARQVIVSGCLVGGNSRIAGSGIASGINVAAGVSDIAITGSVIGPVMNFANPQKWAIWVTGAVTRTVLSGNSLSNNASGKYNTPLPAGAIDASSV